MYVFFSNNLVQYCPAILAPVGIRDIVVVDDVVDETIRVDTTTNIDQIRDRRSNYKNKYPDSLYVTIWILYGAGIET